MAKTPAKTAPAKAPAKKSPAKPKVKAAKADVAKVSADVLAKLKSLDIEQQLQADLEWCLGSYHADQNPVGLYDMLGVALTVFEKELQKKTKGVTTKVVQDIEKALASK